MEDNIGSNGKVEEEIEVKERKSHGVRKLLVGLGMAAAATTVSRVAASRLRKRHDPEAGEILSEPLGEKGHYVRSFDGTRIYSEEVGQGPTLVLVHGYFCNTDMWHYQKKLLSDRFRVVCFDQRGHRRSDCPDGKPFRLDDLAMDLKAVIDSYAPKEPVILVGHSMGGMSILKFLNLYPEEMGKHVKGVGLVGTSNVPLRYAMAGGEALGSIQKPVVEPTFRWIAQHPRFADGVKDVLVHTSPFLVATRYLGYGSEASLTHLEYIAEMAEKTSMKGACQAGLGLMCEDEPTSLEGLRRSGIPVLIWVGEKDKLTRPVISIQMKEQLPAAELRIIPDAGHPSYLEEYRLFNDALEELARKSFAG